MDATLLPSSNRIVVHDSDGSGLRPVSSSALLLTVVIPCYNEASILEDSIRKLIDYLEGTDWRDGRLGGWEIVFVDDGSKDETVALLTAWNARDARVRFESYTPNGGQGKALQTGFAAARGEWIFCVDADLDYGPEHIAQLFIAARQQSADIVVGSPFIREGAMLGVPFVRYWMSRLMNWYFKIVLRIGVSTYTSILRLYRRQCLQNMLLTSRDKDILPEILIKAHLLGLSVVEAPAILQWKSETTRRRGKGSGIRASASKAVSHLLWGLIENPLGFFLVPASLAAFLTAWFGLALLVLFCQQLSAMKLSLQSITDACHGTVLLAPQTCIIFALSFHAALILFCIGILVFQNKVKKQQDFICFTKLHTALEKCSHGCQGE